MTSDLLANAEATAGIDHLAFISERLSSWLTHNLFLLADQSNISAFFFYVDRLVQFDCGQGVRSGRRLAKVKCGAKSLKDS